MIKNIFLKESERKLINKLCQKCTGDDYDRYCINKFSTYFTWTAYFDDGIEMNVKVCSGDYGEPLWIESVLFENGNEIACSEVQDRLKDDFIMEYGNKYYIIHFI